MDWFLPGYKAGGPIRSVANMVRELSEDFDFYIVTRNTDLSDHKPYKDVEPNKWLKKYNVHIYYMSADNYSKDAIKKLIGGRKYDVMYLNSLYSYQYALTPLRIRNKHFPDLKTVLAPRGMLGAGALKTKSLKKAIFLKTTQLFQFFKNITWHATSEDEKTTISKMFGSNAKIIIGAPISIPAKFDTTNKINKYPGAARFFFIGRVSEHKNISFALDCFVKLKPKGEILFDIFGAVEEQEYLQKIENQIKQLPSNIKVNYIGPMPNEELKIKLQAEYHFMLFPTKGESFSHSIVDSWNSGCPVLISDKTPWLDLEYKSLGWNFDLRDPMSLIDSINQAVNLDQETYQNWSNSCVRFYTKNVCSEEITNKNKLIFE